MKKNKKIKIGCEVIECKKCKEDSIAHKIKSYFEIGTIQNRLLFRYNIKTNKLEISKKHLIYLLSLCNDVETIKDYEIEIVDRIEPF